MQKRLNNRINLTGGWKFSVSQKTYKSELIPNENIRPGNWFEAEVPGTIHTDLLNNGLIDNPFYSDNELKLGWIAEQDWVYETEFEFSEDSADESYLIFESLDTIADVFLNKSKLGSTENMFLKYKFSLKGKLKKGTNILKVIFHSPVKYAGGLERKLGKLPAEPSTERVYIRKAPYSFGWDWGPSFPTSGIWKNVYIEKIPFGKIDGFLFDTINISNKKATVEIRPIVNLYKKGNYKISFRLFNDDQTYEKTIKINPSKKISTRLTINNADLWWPNGYGKQSLYSLDIKLLDGEGNTISLLLKKVGIRRVELKLKENKKPTFKFRINNKDIFCKGADWIPSDSFISRISDEKYTKLLELAKDGNMNMIRVWGGGFYENDKFYELCNELGLLVWQDFMFACGAYPEHESFIKNIKNEAKENVDRLQHHPSIALWCGNNENEWMWFSQQKVDYKKMPGYKIYHSVLPGILKTIDPHRAYWPSSPFGNENDPDSFESGNTHQWDIWSRWVNYTEVVDDRSLFVTEFGFQSPANKDTFEKYIPAGSRNINSRIFEHHNKQIEGPERIIKFLNNHLPVETNWDDFLYLTQLNQGFALKTCLEHWATNGRTNGSLIWQLNDSWPVTSWAIVDYELKPKLAYHFVKNIFSPQILSFTKNRKLTCQLFNRSGSAFEGHAKILVYDLNENKVISEQTEIVNVKGDKSKSIRISEVEGKDTSTLLFIGSIYNLEDKLIHRNYFLDNKWKYVRLPHKDLDISLSNGYSQKLKLASNSLNMFIDLYCSGVTFGNRGFILLPGEQIEIEIISGGNIKKTKNIKCYTLNDYLGNNNL